MDNNLQQYKKTLTDRLLERSRESGMPNTELENLRTEGIKRFETAFDDPNTPVLPSDVFGKFGTFRKAFEPQQPTEQDLLDQIISLNKANNDSLATSGTDIFGQLTGTTPTLKGQAAYKEVLKQGGNKLITAKTQGERESQAETILSLGGVDAYRQQIPLGDLLTDKESEEIQKQADFATEIARAMSLFTGGDQFGGTGPLAQFVPGFAAGAKTREMRRAAEQLTAAKLKEISGATVSDKEVERLSKFLPTSGKTEIQNLEDLQRLSRGLQINQELFEIAKRNNLTASQALNQFGPQVFAKYGEEFSGEQGQEGDEIDQFLNTI